MKVLRQRIKSVTSTQQLTKAMGLVASSKIRKASAAMMKAREYVVSFEKTMSLLSGGEDAKESPFLAQRDEGRTRLVVIAGDRGLAGGYNANVFRLCQSLEEAEVSPIGKRACERFGAPIISSERFTFDDAYALSEVLCKDFAEGKYDRLGIVYSHYHSVMEQEAKVRYILPLTKGEETTCAPILEPDFRTVLDIAVKEYVAGMITSLVRESFACEVAARRNAMDSAQKNAKQMIDDLSLAYNRARQGEITQEITEIVAVSGNTR